MTIEPEDLYDRLHSLSKSLEGRGRLDEHDNPDAYKTVLDAMNFVMSVKTPLTEAQIQEMCCIINATGARPAATALVRAVERVHGVGV